MPYQNDDIQLEQSRTQDKSLGYSSATKILFSKFPNLSSFSKFNSSFACSISHEVNICLHTSKYPPLFSAYSSLPKLLIWQFPFQAMFFLHATIGFLSCAIAKFNYPGTYVPLESTWDLSYIISGFLGGHKTLRKRRSLRSWLMPNFRMRFQVIDPIY